MDVMGRGEAIGREGFVRERRGVIRDGMDGVGVSASKCWFELYFATNKHKNDR
jgi:hypothetical protein